MNERLAWLHERLLKLYDVNPFVGLLGLKVAGIGEGEATLTMPVTHEVHGNLYGVAHGGALASLADTVMGVSCATLSKRVVTLEMNMNFISSAPAGETVTANAKVIHDGKQTMVVEAELRGSERLVAKARGTFFVIGVFDFEQD